MNKETILIIIVVIAVLYFVFFKNKKIEPDEELAKPILKLIASIKNRYDKFVSEGSNNYKIEKQIIFGIIYVESGGHPGAIGGVGEIGLMQIRQGALTDSNKYTGNKFTLKELTDPRKNILVGTGYLAWLYYTQTKKDLKKTIQSYNAGWGTVQKNPNASITYYNKVMLYAKYF